MGRGHGKRGAYQCPYCPSKIDHYLQHIRRSHPDKPLPDAPPGPPPTTRPKSTPISFGNGEQDYGVKSPENLKSFIASLPDDEFKLDATEPTPQPQAAQPGPTDEAADRRKIKVNRILNNWLKEMTAKPAVSFLNTLVKAKKQPEFTEIEEKSLVEAFDIATQIIGLEFDIDPFMVTITNRWAALCLPPVVIAFTLLFRPGLMAERIMAAQRKKEEAQNVNK